MDNYPYNRFLLFLVSRKRDVNEVLDRYELPPIGDHWVWGARDKIRDEAPFALVQHLGSDDDRLAFRPGVLDWAEDNGFRELWQVQREFSDGLFDSPLDLAFQIFANPYTRGTMGLLLLSQVDNKIIEDIFKEKYDLVVEDDTMETYQRIFWDVNHMGRTSWEKYVGSLPVKHERHYIAVGLGSPTLDVVRDLIGVKVVVDAEYIVSDVATSTYLKYKEALAQPSPEEAGIEMWMNATLRAAKQMKDMKPKSGEADEIGLATDRFKGLFSVQLTKSSHPTLAELQGEVSETKAPGTPEKKE